MKLDPLSLQLLISVVEDGTIAAAAARHHIAAAAVSKRLSELEYKLSTELLIRSNKGIQATAAGYTLINLARGVLRDLDDIVLQMQDFAAGTRGSVRVTANISVMTQFLPRALKSFHEKYPLVRVLLEEKVSTAILLDVANNVSDIGIYTEVPHGDNVEVYPYGVDQLVLIVPKGHPLAGRRTVPFAETLDYDYVGLHAGSSLHYQMAEEASKLGRSLKLRIQVLGYDAQCLMVEAGLGIGILPKASLRTYGGLALEQVELDESWAHRRLSICVRRYDALPVAAKLFFDHLQGAK
ncbi:LysR substrate-binding domain-containing protein [Rugamonas sp.]|uniref:LysR substrate-binding domain-containing protein n=1 Tax=Rugamonas sp. TaxID=1926287 RepID=UPI0025E1545D|nr:LysR substrate-binding domain-containing protein [Rugamonas sp.]